MIHRLVPMHPRCGTTHRADRWGVLRIATADSSRFGSVLRWFGHIRAGAAVITIGQLRVRLREQLRRLRAVRRSNAALLHRGTIAAATRAMVADKAAAIGNDFVGTVNLLLPS